MSARTGPGTSRTETRCDAFGFTRASRLSLGDPAMLRCGASEFRYYGD